MKHLIFFVVCKTSVLCNDKPNLCDAKISKDIHDESQDCTQGKWHSLITLSDTTSGIQNVKITSPGGLPISKSTNDIIEYPITIGSRYDIDIWVEISCCYDGVEITAHDLNGNSVVCVSGINPNGAVPMATVSMTYKLMSIVVLMRGVWI